MKTFSFLALMAALLVASASAQSASQSSLLSCSTPLLNSTNGFDIVLLGSPLPSVSPAAASSSSSSSSSSNAYVLDASDSFLGRVAGRGNGALYNCIIGNPLYCSSAASTVSLYLTGSLNSTASELVCGYSMVQGGITGTLFNSTAPSSSLSSSSSLMNFNSTAYSLLQASDELCSLSSNGGRISLINNQLILDASSVSSSSSSSSGNTYAIFDLPNSDLSNINSIIINGTMSSEYIIINVGNSSTSISGNLTLLDLNSVNSGALSSTQILWNFCQASSLNLDNALLMGSILAPRASVTINQSTLEGSLVADSLTASFFNQVPTPYAGTFCFNSTSSSA